jgi:hypothetical protein
MGPFSVLERDIPSDEYSSEASETELPPLEESDDQEFEPDSSRASDK